METKARRDLTKDVFRYTEDGKRDFKNHPHSDRAPPRWPPALLPSGALESPLLVWKRGGHSVRIVWCRKRFGGVSMYTTHTQHMITLINCLRWWQRGPSAQTSKHKRLKSLIHGNIFCNIKKKYLWRQGPRAGNLHASKGHLRLHL